MKLNSLEELQRVKSNNLVNNSVEYKGKMQSYQTGQLRLNNYQNQLFKRALYGLSFYTKEEVLQMPKQKRKRISRVNKRAQICLNVMKQERTNALCRHICTTKLFFKENSGALFFEKDVEIDPNFINTLEFKDLGIKKVHMISRFIKEGILPKDFYNLKEAV